MIEVSNVFQQYAQEYILSNPGSIEESTFFDKIMSAYAPLMKVESSLVTTVYYEAFFAEVLKRNNSIQLSAIEDIFEGAELKDNCVAIVVWRSLKH